MRLNPQLTFDHYVPSTPRAAAPAACRAHAAGGTTRGRCLILHGPSGVGKTHLLHAIAHAARERKAAARVVMITAADISADLVEAIRRDAVPDLYRKYAGMDVLLVDDLHVLAERPATQAGVARLFATWLDAGVIVACAASCRPGELLELTSSLPPEHGARRLALRPPSRSQVRRIVRQRAITLGAVPPARVIDGMSRQSHGDVRKALGLLERWRLEQKLSAATRGGGSSAPAATGASGRPDDRGRWLPS